MRRAAAPSIAPDVMEGTGDLGGHQRPPIGRDAVQRIEADGEGEVSRIKIDDVVDAPGRSGIGNRFSQVTVRIEQREAAASMQVGEYQAFQ